MSKDLVADQFISGQDRKKERRKEREKEEGKEMESSRKLSSSFPSI